MMNRNGIEYSEIEKNVERIVNNHDNLVEIKEEESEETKKFYVTLKQTLPDITIEKYYSFLKQNSILRFFLY